MTTATKLTVQEIGVWDFGTDIGIYNKFRFVKREDAVVIDRQTKKPVSYVFRFTIRENEAGEFVLTTCASSRNATRYRKFKTAGEAVAVGYAWLNRRFVVEAL
jgi:hypothetical protein